MSDDKRGQPEGGRLEDRPSSLTDASGVAAPRGASSVPAEATTTRRPRRWRRRLAWASLGLLVLFCCAPWLLTFGPLKGWLVRRLSAETHLELEVGGLSLAWWSPIRVRSIVASTPSGEAVRVEELRTSRTLWGLAIQRPVDKGTITLLAPELRLTRTRIAELRAAIEQMRPREGLLGAILDPDKDLDVAFEVERGALLVGDLKSPAEDEAKSESSGADAPIDERNNNGAGAEGSEALELLTDSAQARFAARRRSGKVTLSVEPGPVIDNMRVTRDVCDLGLKYVAPILDRAADVEGSLSLELAHCELAFDNLAAMEVEGTLRLHEVQAAAGGPIVTGVAEIVGEAVGRDVPLGIRIAEDSDVHFVASEGGVYHEGLRFGLPRVLPNFLLFTEGRVGFDQTLDLEVGLHMQFDRLGDQPILERLGTRTLAVPIQGTFGDVKVGVGKGQLVRSAVKEFTGALGGEEVDIGPLLERLGGLGLLRRRDRAGSSPPDASGPGNPAADQPSPDIAGSDSASSGASGADAATGDASETRPSLGDRFRRWRERRSERGARADE